jgi:Holliday junction DNA helicase RuvA
MFAYFRGTVQGRDVSGGPQDRLVIDVGGIGYELLVSPQTMARLPAVGSEATVYASLAVRENDWTLYGFATKADKEMFILLQSVTGVGPKLALTLVGTLGTEQIIDAIANEDQKLLSHAPGVGAKVAQRIILELKNKLDNWRRGGITLAGSATTGGAPAAEEARAILENLGYTPTEINMAFKSVQGEDEVSRDVELLVQHSLKLLGSV